MTSLKKSTTRTFYDHSNDPWFKNQYIESTGVTVKPIPDYLKQRQGGFGDIDGGAFPDYSDSVKYNNKPSSSSKQKSAAVAKESTKRTLEKSLDPLDPANSLKHKRGPKAFGSRPVPVVYLPPRPDDTVKNQEEDWTIPPCISNWENPDGDAVPLEIRIDQFRRRYLYNYDGGLISDNFAKLTKVLRVADERATEAISMRSEVQKEMEKERKEQELRDARGDYESESDADTEPTGQTET